MCRTAGQQMQKELSLQVIAAVQMWGSRMGAPMQITRAPVQGAHCGHCKSNVMATLHTIGTPTMQLQECRILRCVPFNQGLSASSPS